MNSRVPITVLAVAVVLLSAVVLWLVFDNREPSSRTTPLPAEPVKNPLAERPLADSTKLDAERRRLAGELEKMMADYFKAQQDREAALREELAKAREEDRQRLEQEIARLRESTQGYASSLAAWRDRVEETPDPAEETVAETATPKDFEAPPIPPDQPGEEEDANQQMLQGILKIGAMALCLAEPPLCPIAMIVTNLLGSLGTLEGGREVFDTLGKVQRGEPVSAEDLNRLLKMGQEHPELGEPLGQLLGTLLDKKDDAPTAGDAAEIVRKLLPGETAGIPDQIAEEIQRNSPCELLKSFLERDGNEARFASKDQKRAVHMAILVLRSPEAQKIWDSCLAPLGTV